MIDKIKELIEEYELSHHEEQIIAALKPCIRLTTVPRTTKDFPVGVSRFGGIPDLPKSIEYPSFEGRPLTFLAQLNLEELSSFDTNKLLPSAGILFFFYDAEKQPWWMEGDKRAWKVIHFNGDTSELMRHEVNTIVPEEYCFKSRQVKPKLEYHLPSWENDAFDMIDFKTDDDEETYMDLVSDIQQLDAKEENEREPVHKIFSYPDEIQGKVSDNWLLDYEKIHRNYPKSDNEWILLLQVDTDDELEMMWGDGGTLYFGILKDDLINKRFEEVYFRLQCF